MWTLTHRPAKREQGDTLGCRVLQQVRRRLAGRFLKRTRPQLPCWGTVLALTTITAILSEGRASPLMDSIRSKTSKV
jgi:hypothetical protein